MRVFGQIKELVSTATNETLKDMYNQLQKSELTVEEIAVITAIEGELKKRGIIKLNEETFEYEFTV